jgi:hypothetical protein
MIIGIISIIMNIIYCAVLNLKLFTDRYTLPDGIRREARLSAVDRLYGADMLWLPYLLYVLAAACIIVSVLFLLKAKTRTLKTVCIVCALASTAVFAAAMIAAARTHLHY